jgi:splicing factor 3A subunit 1
MEKKMKGIQLETPSPFHFIGDIPEDITPLDLDIMKLTAQFVARNGHQFQTGLMNREHKNPQFEFLKATSSENPYFQQLVESYSKCIVASKGILYPPFFHFLY